MTLEARNVTVKVRDKTLVDSVSLYVVPGEVVGIIGPNGAGKSTLFRAMTGDARLAGGSVLMQGSPLNARSRAEMATIRGILAQTQALNFAFRVSEVVMIGRAPHIKGRETAKDHEIVQAAMQAAEIEHLQDRLFTTLSGGEQQRVHLARVFAQIWEAPIDQPRYLLVDEPTNNLDLRHQHTTLQMARQFATESTAVLVILHDLNLAAQYVDRVAIMNDGRLIATGTPYEVLSADIIHHVFGIDVTIVAHPQMNFPVLLPSRIDVVAKTL